LQLIVTSLMPEIRTIRPNHWSISSIGEKVDIVAVLCFLFRSSCLFAWLSMYILCAHVIYVCRRTMGLWQFSHCYSRWRWYFSTMLDCCCQSANMVCTSQQSACCRSSDSENWGL